MKRGVCLSVCLSVCRVPRPNWTTKRHRKSKIGRMEDHQTSNLWTKRSNVKVTRPINAVTESVLYLPNGKAYEHQTWYTYGAREPVSLTSAMTSKVKGQGLKVTWCVWEVLAHKSKWKVPETPKLVGRLHTPQAITCTSFKVKGQDHQVDYNVVTENVSYPPSNLVDRWSTKTSPTNAVTDIQGQRSRSRCHVVRLTCVSP